MKLTAIKCLTDCFRVTLIACHEGLDFRGNHMVYCCPICKGKNVETLIKPFEIEPPIIKIKGGDAEENSCIAAALAQLSGQGSTITSLRELRSYRRRDDESGEGPREELEQPIIDGVVVPRKGAPCSEYEAEVSKYLGIPETGG